jgi:hypothetical protein
MAKLRMTAVEGQGQVLGAQVNPRTIELDHAVTWQRQPQKGPRI